MAEDSFIFSNVLNCSVVLQGCFLKYGSKYVLGDQKGVTSFFSLRRNSSKKYAADLIFTNGDPKEIPIKSVCTSKERIFNSSGTQVTALSRKGRIVQNYENNLAIHGVSVDKGHLVFFNDYFLYRLLEGNDEPEMFLSNEKILSIFINGKFVYFCCNNQSINRITLLDGDFDRIDHSYQVPHNVTSHFIHNKLLYFGTQKGTIGVLDINSSRPDVSPKILLELDKDLTIQSLSFFHFEDADPKDVGNWHLAVGFRNGELRIFSSDYKTEYLSKKIQGTSITNIHPTPDLKSLLVSTYSGEIAVLTTKQNISSAPGQTISSPNLIRQHHEDRKKLMESVSYQERILKDLKRRYLKLSRENVGTKLTYTPRCRFFLVDDYYLLSVRCDVSLDTVILYSQSVRVNILGNPPEGFDLSKSYHRENASCYFLLTAIGEETKGLELRCRTLEGNYGDLEVFVAPLRTPKISTKVVIPIKPLSLHERVSIEEEEEEEVEEMGEEEGVKKKKKKKKDPFDMKKSSTLMISGDFSFETVHHWVWSCCNDLPRRNVGKKKVLKYWFKNSYQGTFLKVKYQKNEIEFISNNISTISILEEFISKQATLKNTKVKVRFKIDFKSVGDMVKSHIFPSLREEFMFQEKMNLLESIKEMSEHGGGLVKQNLDILDQEDEIRERLEKKKVNLQFLYDIMVRLCRDKAKFKRKSPQASLVALRELLKGDYRELTLSKLLKVFNSKE